MKAAKWLLSAFLYACIALQTALRLILYLALIGVSLWGIRK